MKLESKYNLNQEVHIIERERKNIWEECEICEGEGKVTIVSIKQNKVTRGCPDCQGRRGKQNWIAEKEWKVKRKVTLGQVRIEITNLTKDGIADNKGHYEQGKDEIEIVYMAYETGVKSGNIWKEEKLFASLEEAQAECDERNKNPEALEGN